jgi:stress response protein YsnF
VIIDREVQGPLPIRREGDTTIIPIVEEVLVLGKRFVLKEEVHVTRSVREEHHIERVTLKRQESEIERVDAEGRSALVEVPADRSATKERARRSPRKSILGDT